MEEKKFFQLFLYSLVNLVSFLLSVIFLTSLYNVRSQTKLIGIDLLLDEESYFYSKDFEKFRSYGNSYVGIAVLFTFCFFGFFGFMVILMLLVKQYKIDNLDRERMRKIHANPTKSENNVDSKDNNNNNDNNKGNNGTYENSEERPVNYVQVSVSNVYLEDSSSISPDTLRKIMIFFYIYCQGIYLIEVMVLTAYLSVSKDLEKDVFQQFRRDGKYFTRIYRDLVIVGYVFLFLFLVFDLYTLILACGRNRRKKKSIRKPDIFHEDTEVFCLFFSNCITKCCEKMGTAFSNCERETENDEEKLKEILAELDKNIEDLENYLKNLEDLNQKIENKRTVGKDELEKLNLPTADNSMETERFNIGTRK
jgi:hypothetical protein